MKTPNRSTFTHKSGFETTGDADAVARFAEICREADELEAMWVLFLKHYLVSAAHPDDGWVDRMRDRVHFAYPYFKDSRLGLSDTVVLGAPDKFRVVRVTDISDSLLDLTWYSFVEEEEDTWLHDNWKTERAQKFSDWWHHKK